MSDDYYDTIGEFLQENLTSTEDPFLIYQNKRNTRYRETEHRIERRRPPEIKEKYERVVVPKALVEDFAVLQLLPGEPLSLCKKSWKRLLKKHHPDTLKDTGLSEPEATKVVRRINRSYRRIEHWYTTGKILSDLELK